MGTTKILQADTVASASAPADPTYHNPDEISPLPIYREHDTGPHLGFTELEQILRVRWRVRDNDAKLWQTFIDCNPGWTENDSRGNVVEEEFYSAIDAGDEEVIALMIKNHLFSANTAVTWSQETPLLRAVGVKNVNVVKLLLELGAEKDAFGTVNKCYATGVNLTWDYFPIKRTPLQLAASLGHLVLVKLLMEHYKCDDSLVAPDGQIAIRLAAENGHTEVVEYLPPRRGGGYLRWKHKNQLSIKRIKKVVKNIGGFFKFFLWEVEKFFLWTLPKNAIVKPVANYCNWCWKNRECFAPWCKRQFLSIPAKAKTFTKWVKQRTVKAGKDLIEFTTKTLPRLAKDLVHWLWKLLTVDVPAVVKILIKQIKDGAIAIVKFISEVVSSIISFVSTAVEAILSFFKRVTLLDVWNGFCRVLSSIFIAFPKLLASWFMRFWTDSKDLLKLLFGLVGWYTWWIFTIILWIAAYVPRQVWKILQSVWGSLARAAYEVRVYFNPKAL